jgi:hypothetical protein
MQDIIKKFSQNENELKELRLNEEDLKLIDGFNDLLPNEREKLKDLVFNLSLVLYKSFKHEPA